MFSKKNKLENGMFSKKNILKNGIFPKNHAKKWNIFKKKTPKMELFERYIYSKNRIFSMIIIIAKKGTWSRITILKREHAMINYLTDLLSFLGTYGTCFSLNYMIDISNICLSVSILWSLSSNKTLTKQRGAKKIHKTLTFFHMIILWWKKKWVLVEAFLLELKELMYIIIYKNFISFFITCKKI